MGTVQALAVTITAGIIAAISIIAITVLLLNGNEIPDPFWGVMGTSSGAAVLGGAFAQGAQTANRNRSDDIR